MRRKNMKTHSTTILAVILLLHLITVSTIAPLARGQILRTLHSFQSSDGASPWAGLVLGSDGNFYGTTVSGGPNGWGTAFKMATNGALTTLVYFNYSNGAQPVAGLVRGATAISMARRLMIL